MIQIRRFLFECAAALGLVAAFTTGCGPRPVESGAGQDIEYPQRMVSIICPWAAGGGTDRVSRFWADQLQGAFGKPFTVVNRTGGSGAVGHSTGALAKPDGHTIMMATFELNTMHWMGISDLTYRDFDWLMQVNADAAALLVQADASWKSLGDLLEYIEANPGKLRMSGTATGGAWDLARAGMLLAAKLPVDSVVWVPTKGAAPSLVELLGGHIEAVCCSVPEAAAQIDAGQLRVLAVMADERLAEYPDIPTARESGVEWSAVGWRGLALPKGTPDAIRDALLRECRSIAQSDEYRDFMKKNGFNITIREPADFEAFVAEQDSQWKTVIEAAGYAKSN